MKSEAGRQASELVSEPLDCFKKKKRKRRKQYILYFIEERTRVCLLAISGYGSEW